MALLSKEGREMRFKALGLEYDKEGIKALQKRYLRKKDVDGIYGADTDNLLRHVYNVKTYTKNFRPEEFKCECGGRYCTGYPSYMKKVELQNLQRIRDHWNKPMTVTCGLRCRPYNNSLAGSIPNSLHLTGYACDFNMDGVTESTAQRKKAIKWIRKLPNHHYTYGHGYNSCGASISAPYMGIGNGAAIHTDTSKPKTATVKKQTPQEKGVEWLRKLAKSGYHYVRYNLGPEAHECPICHDHPKGKYYGGNCIWESWASWHHGMGLTKCKCNCHVIDNATAERILRASDSKALSIAREHTGLHDIKVIRNGGKVIPQSKLRPMDICLNYKGSTYIHTFPYIGNGKTIDCRSSGSQADNIKERKALPAKVAIRYMGK